MRARHEWPEDLDFLHNHVVRRVASMDLVIGWSPPGIITRASGGAALDLDIQTGATRGDLLEEADRLKAELGQMFALGGSASGFAKAEELLNVRWALDVTPTIPAALRLLEAPSAGPALHDLPRADPPWVIGTVDLMTGPAHAAAFSEDMLLLFRRSWATMPPW